MRARKGWAHGRIRGSRVGRGREGPEHGGVRLEKGRNQTDDTRLTGVRRAGTRGRLNRSGPTVDTDDELGNSQEDFSSEKMQEELTCARCNEGVKL
ncbi:hypothetical protein PVAP13_4KG019100 [Panicum virgatum]|uniref:Uncharacterized protein n=1 Tax=Panicum virgatum TaxID=38727 RepID=A0A8T0TE41_PANVG|nr:hypothetical protein PVAP13_4KG019100 [Panicum virgatum]